MLPFVLDIIMKAVVLMRINTTGNCRGINNVRNYGDVSQLFFLSALNGKPTNPLIPDLFVPPGYNGEYAAALQEYFNWVNSNGIFGPNKPVLGIRSGQLIPMKPTTEHEKETMYKKGTLMEAALNWNADHQVNEDTDQDDTKDKGVLMKAILNWEA